MFATNAYRADEAWSKADYCYGVVGGSRLPPIAADFDTWLSRSVHDETSLMGQQDRMHT